MQKASVKAVGSYSVTYESCPYCSLADFGWAGRSKRENHCCRCTKCFLRTLVITVNFLLDYAAFQALRRSACNALSRVDGPYPQRRKQVSFWRKVLFEFLGGGCNPFVTCAVKKQYRQSRRIRRLERPRREIGEAFFDHRFGSLYVRRHFDFRMKFSFLDMYAASSGQTSSTFL